ncbi:r2r3-myb transcription factor, putative [Ricinus communis]|uniref:R2r3-myb transcription factor, putative n=1 Tax=Ricinus communis TaxID=3988 RepID=B9RRC6_RICCO|nr:r2r3-myb transcription factor, putative [Ricinus communis]
MGRSPCCSKEGLRRGTWTALEDKILTNYIQAHGEGRWRIIPKRAVDSRVSPTEKKVASSQQDGTEHCITDIKITPSSVTEEAPTLGISNGHINGSSLFAARENKDSQDFMFQFDMEELFRSDLLTTHEVSCGFSYYSSSSSNDIWHMILSEEMLQDFTADGASDLSPFTSLVDYGGVWRGDN